MRQRNKERFSFFTGVMLYVGLALLFSSYDNLTMHRKMNDALYNRFVSVLGSSAEFKNYQISNSRDIKGEAVTESGEVTINQGDSTLTVREWLTHGGFSADEPHGPMALRHFYDPKAITGVHYLTDAIPPGIVNPKLDILEWALEHNGEIGHSYPQFYSWKDGQESIVKALSETDKDAQDRLMAHGWRCLGESMHALADMVCPVHTRNDGHPYSDPYEDAIRGGRYIVSDPSKFWNQDLVDFSKTNASVLDIYKAVATYTNENFFTTQTVRGQGVEEIHPAIRPSNPYDLPFAQESGDGWDYDPSDFIFYRSLNGERIKMAKDRYYFAGVGTNYRTKKAYVDLEVAESQSQVLISNFLGVGPEIMRRYLPKIEVELHTADIDEGSIWGKVEVKEGNGYDDAVEFGATVIITNLSTGKSVETVAYGDGWYNTEDLEFEEGNQIQTQVSIGGLIIYSKKLTVSGSSYRAFIESANDFEFIFIIRKMILDNGDVQFIQFGNDLANPEVLTLNGNTLTSVSNYTSSDEFQSREFTIEFNDAFDKIESIYGELFFRIENTGEKREISTSFVIEDIDFNYKNGSGGNVGNWIMYKEYGSLQENIKSFEYSYERLNKITMETYSERSVGIDWNVDPAEPNDCTAVFARD